MEIQEPSAELIAQFDAEIDTSVSYLIETFDWLGLQSKSQDPELHTKLSDAIREILKEEL